MLKFVVFSPKTTDKSRKTVGNMFIISKALRRMKMKNKIRQLFEELLEDYYLAEDDNISERASNYQEEIKELDNKIEDYRNKLNIILKDGE